MISRANILIQIEQIIQLGLILLFRMDQTILFVLDALHRVLSEILQGFRQIKLL